MNFKYVVIDGMNLCHKNYHKLAALSTKEGMKTGLIFGFIKSLAALQRRFKDAQIYVLWDTKSKMRYEIYPEYKAARKAKRDPEEYAALLSRVADLKKILEHHNITQVTADGYEADDLAQLVVDSFKEDILLITSDKDWLQLIDDQTNIKVLRSGKKEMIYSESTFLKTEGYPAKGSIIYKCLKGDKSDGIKGIYRFPTKDAILLSNRVSNIENFFVEQSCLEGISEKWKQTILQNKEHLRLNEKLVTLYGNIDNAIETKGKYDVEKLKPYYELFEFGSLLSSIKKEAFIKRKRALTQKRKSGTTEAPRKRFKVKARSTSGPQSDRTRSC